ncbi:hypothetical protein OAG68_00955 [bacterium]|nr:hypothetical protein [bacterium]
MKELFCGQCCEKLSRHPLQHGDAKMVMIHDARPLISEGKYLLAEELSYEFPVPITHFVDMNSMLLVDHPDDKRLTGCCGPGFTDKYNQVCWKCRLEIGILYADCIGSHFLAINTNRLTKQPKW